MFRLIIIIAISMIGVLGVDRVVAQDAPPGTDRDIPALSVCTVEPATAAEVLEVYREVAATPVAPTSAPATPALFIQPEGEPASEETKAAIETANRELIACTNVYGFPGLVPLSTDKHIRDILSQDIAAGLTEEIAAEFLAATPEPPTPEQSVSLVDVRDVTVLDDGRIGSIIVADEPGVGLVTLYFIYSEEDGRYLLDETLDLPSNATPAP